MNIREASLAELVSVHNQISELSPIANSDYFAARIGDKARLALIAEINSVPVAYKLGYWISDHVFYSWLGGVNPAYRKQGIAKQLLLEQERRVVAQGAKEIRVKSMNQYRPMLQLLIAQGYDITGTETTVQGEIKIHFMKKFCQ